MQRWRHDRHPAAHRVPRKAGQGGGGDSGGAAEEVMQIKVVIKFDNMSVDLAVPVNQIAIEYGDGDGQTTTTTLDSTLTLDQAHAGGFSKTITALELEAIQDTLPGAGERLQGTAGYGCPARYQDSPSTSYGDRNEPGMSAREAALAREAVLEAAFAASEEQNAEMSAEMHSLRDELSAKLEMVDAQLARIASP